MTLAKAWYDSESLGTALTLFAGLITGFFGGWATLRAANPKRQLAYWMPSVTPLLNASDSVGDLLVMRGGQALRDPHVLDVRLANRGHRDIASSHFDGGLPILLDLGAPIVEVLGATSLPTSLHMPAVTMDGTALKIAPGLIAKGQTISLSLLVDGLTPRLTCQASLIDVTVQERRDPNRQQGRLYGNTLLLGFGASILTLILWALLAAAYGDGFFSAISVLAIWFVAAVIRGTSAAWARQRRLLQPPDQS